MVRLLLPLSAAALGLVIVALAFGFRTQSTEAIAPCLAHTNTAEELDYVQMIEDWRNTYITNQPGAQVDLIVDSRLTFAAYGYAQFLANNPAAVGHNADNAGGQRPWVTRALNCDYLNPGGPTVDGGEGIAIEVIEGGGANVSKNEAYLAMQQEPGNSINVRPDVGGGIRCVGTAKATSSNGEKSVWVMLLFGGEPGNCTIVPPTPTKTNTPTPTNTRTPTNTPTATATATPTAPFRSFAPGSVRDEQGE